MPETSGLLACAAHHFADAQDMPRIMAQKYYATLNVDMVLYTVDLV